jgi:hypothetical protein
MTFFPHTPESRHVLPGATTVQVRGDNKIGAPEITRPTDYTDPSASYRDDASASVDSDAQARFNLAVDHCRGVNKGQGYFHQHKSRLGTAIDAAYNLVCAIRGYPGLEQQLRNLDLLQDRQRKLGKAKTHLLCMYCALQPKNEDDHKNCSDYTAFLLQAEYEQKTADEFADWVKGKTLKSCLRDVRARKRAEAAGERSLHTTPSTDRRLTIRQDAKGVHGSLDGKKFELPGEALSTIVQLIERECF